MLRGLSLVFFYFDFTVLSKQSIDGLLRSIIAQLSSQSLLPSARSLYQKFGGKHAMKDTRLASEEDLVCTVKDLLTEVSKPVFLVIDALDECTQVPELLSLLAKINSWGIGGLRMLAISRKEKDIQDCISPFMPFQISLENALVDQDIKLYIDSRLSSTHRLKRWTQMPDIKQLIQQTLSKGANGM
jgi:hypothetical protein